MTCTHCVWLALLLSSTLVDCKVTMEQMEKSGEMIRNVCQPRVKITDEMANGIREGVFPNDKVLKMKKNKLNYDAAIKQMDMLLPDDIVEECKNAITVCKEAAVGVKDACEAAFVLVQMHVQK